MHESKRRCHEKRQQPHLSRRQNRSLFRLWSRGKLLVNWDSFRLERAFTNLLSTSTKYSPQGCAVEVRAYRTHENGMPTAVVSVQDQGLGIPTEAVSHIFERFYRAKNAADIPGVGIGLAGTR